MNEIMLIPSKSEIVNTLKDSNLQKRNILLDDVVFVPKIKGFHTIPGNGAYPMMFSGNFGIVFPFTNGYEKYALRLWTKDVDGIKDRLKQISLYLHDNPSPYFVDFEYFEDGMDVYDKQGDAQRVDVVLMDWVEGLTLKSYIDSIICDRSLTREDKSKKFLDIAFALKKMFTDLHKLKISHGDLQHSNMKVLPDGTIKLLDYDCVYVPTLVNPKQNTLGYPAYQPLIRNGLLDSTEKDDYFSEIIIYLSFLILSEKPELWKNEKGYGTDDFSLLFTVEDLRNFSTSPFVQLIRNLRHDSDIVGVHNNEIDSLLLLLEKNLSQTSMSEIEPLPGTITTAKDEDMAAYTRKRTTSSLKISEVDIQTQINAIIKHPDRIEKRLVFLDKNICSVVKNQELMRILKRYVTSKMSLIKSDYPNIYSLFKETKEDSSIIQSDKDSYRKK